MILRVLLLPSCVTEEVEAGTVLTLRPMNTDISCWHPGTTDAVVGWSDQCNLHPNLYADAHSWVGLLPLRCEAAGYVFKRSLRLHTKEAVHRYRKWVEAVTLPEASLQVLTNFFLIHRQESLLWRLVLVR